MKMIVLVFHLLSNIANTSAEFAEKVISETPISLALKFALENEQYIDFPMLSTLIRLAQGFSKSKQSLDKSVSNTFAQLAWIGLDHGDDLALTSLKTLSNVADADKCNISTILPNLVVKHLCSRISQQDQNIAAAAMTTLAVAFG